MLILVMAAIFDNFAVYEYSITHEKRRSERSWPHPSILVMWHLISDYRKMTQMWIENAGRCVFSQRRWPADLLIRDARVYCQDSHATPYTKLGFSCPVNCNNIMEAVKRLKLIDEQNTHHSYNYKSRRYTDEETRNIYLTCERIFKNRIATEELENELHQYHNCKLYLQTGTDFKKIWDLNMTKCFRRTNQQQFLEVFTMILNKHAHGMYKFTKEMSSLILERIIDDDEALRNNKLDIKKLLHFLKKALAIHKKVAHSENITLQSKHCVTLNVPGCYCRTGYVYGPFYSVLPDGYISYIFRNF